MRASTRTASPATRRTGVLPPSICGWMFSMTTRIVPMAAYPLISIRREEQHAERRQAQREGMEAAVRGQRSRLDAAEVAEAAAAILERVAVQALAPVAAAGYSHAIVAARERREVAHDENHLTFAVLSQKRDHARLAVVAVDPLEALPVEVEGVERRGTRIEAVEFTHPALHARVQRVLQHMPVEARIMLPLAPLAELSSHEEELLARMSPHVAVQEPQVCELLPFIAMHPPEERTLAVHDLVVRQRQHEILAERIPEAERQLPVVVLAKQRIGREIGERVVHPAEIPFEPEAKTPQIGGARHHRPGGRFLGDALHIARIAVHLLVELLQERYRPKVLVPAEFIGDPLSVGARVVEIQHGGDAIDAQRVRMEGL